MYHSGQLSVNIRNVAWNFSYCGQADASENLEGYHANSFFSIVDWPKYNFMGLER